jgi:hypothetical protein
MIDAYGLAALHMKASGPRRREPEGEAALRSTLDALLRAAMRRRGASSSASPACGRDCRVAA